jgi:DNA-binding transcriptional MerR regulator
MYRTRAFARLAGVTIKALRYYEHLGLLAPRRTRAGQRRYSTDDLRCLERILALKSLHLPLVSIKRTLQHGSVRLGNHVATLRQRRASLDRAIAAADRIDGDAHPSAAFRRFVAEAAWERWETMRRSRQPQAVRAPDRAPESRRALFDAVAATLDEGHSGADVDRAIDRWRAATDRDAIDAWRRRADWPPAMRAYVASLFDATPDGWERVARAIDARLAAA